MQGRDYAATKGLTSSEESASRMTKEATEPAGTMSDWKLEDLRVRPAENGGVVVTCSKRREFKGKRTDNMAYEDTYQSKDYAFTDPAQALEFIVQELSGAQGSTGSGYGGSVPAPPLAY